MSRRLKWCRSEVLAAGEAVDILTWMTVKGAGAVARIWARGTPGWSPTYGIGLCAGSLRVEDWVNAY
jgi:hypothetical protein